MNRLYSALAKLVNTDKSKKAGDVLDKSNQVTMLIIPAYLHRNRICYEGTNYGN